MIRITAIHMVGGNQHEHIGSVKWINPEDNNTGESTRETMVSWIENGGKAIVSDSRNTAAVGVIDGKPKYIQTYADGKWTDNLLALPRY